MRTEGIAPGVAVATAIASGSRTAPRACSSQAANCFRGSGSRSLSRRGGGGGASGWLWGGGGGGGAWRSARGAPHRGARVRQWHTHGGGPRGDGWMSARGEGRDRRWSRSELAVAGTFAILVAAGAAFVLGLA